MAFSTIFIIVIIGYVFVYAGMIAYDLFIKKDPMELVPKVEDEDIDISDEVGQFQPILIDKDAKPNGGKQEPRTAERVKDDSNTTDKEQKNTSQDLPPDVSTVTFDDEPGNRKSLSDIEPKAADKATTEHIRALVIEVRRQMAAEEKQEQSDVEAQTEGESEVEPKHKAEPSKSKAERGKPTEQPPPFKETLRHAPYRSSAAKPVFSGSIRRGAGLSEGQPAVSERKLTVRPVPVRPWQEKPKKPSGPIPIFERTARVAKENQETKLCGGVTAESLSDKLKSYSTAELREMLKRNNKHWEMKDSARQPDEEDLEILRINASMRRDKAPTFTRTTKLS